MSYGYGRPQRRSMGAWKIRLLIAGAIVAFYVLSYMSNTDVNPITGENQRVGGMTTEQEVALGLQARDQMAMQHGGLYRGQADRDRVDAIGLNLIRILNQECASKGRSIPYRFEFHLLADPNTVNAFALPGGQIFVTYALYRQLNDDQLAGVLGHEIGHVIERHSAQRIAKGRLTQGIVGAAGVAGGDINSAQMAGMIGNVVNMKYGREDELESDKWGIMLTLLADYDPSAMLEVMDILERASGERGGPEFMSTHPAPATRREKIRELIADLENRYPTLIEPALN